MSNLLNRRQVETRCGIGRSTVYRLMRAGQFPEPIKVGVRAVRWTEDEIAAWLESRPRSHGDGVHRASKGQAA